MADSAGEKSFEATPHRRQEAREQGQVVFSQDLSSAALLMLGVLLLMMLGGAVIEFCAKLMKEHLSAVPEVHTNQGTLLSEWLRIAYGLSIVMLPILGLFMLGGALATIFQVGLLWLPDRLAPDVSRISPLAGLKRIFSLSGTARLGFGLVKVLIVSIVAGVVLWTRWDEVLRAGALDIPQFARFLVSISVNTVLWIGVALLILAILDYDVQRWKYEQDLKMTHQEVR